MTRKRLKKLLMAAGMSRNGAEKYIRADRHPTNEGKLNGEYLRAALSNVLGQGIRVMFGPDYSDWFE